MNCAIAHLADIGVQFEQLKKQQKGKKGGKKKADKGDAVDTKEEKEDAPVEPSAEAETEAPEADSEGQTEAKTEETADKEEEVSEEKTEEKADGKADEASAERPTHTRKPSQSEQSRQRSASFRQNSGLTSPSLSKSPALPSISAEEEVQDIYRKQASRIEELEKENKTLKDAQTKLHKAEDELEQLRESSGDVAELKSKAALADKRHDEIEKLVRNTA